MDKVTAERITRMQKSLSTLRKVAGWSAEEFAKELDVTRQTVVNLESGKTEMTKVEFVEKYAEKTGMSKKDAIKQVAKDRDVSKRDIYAEATELDI